MLQRIVYINIIGEHRDQVLDVVKRKSKYIEVINPQTGNIIPIARTAIESISDPLKDGTAQTEDNFSKELPAQSSSYDRAKENKQRVKKIKSPDTSKMIKLEVKELRATFYFKNKTKLRLKIAQLKKAGFEYVIK